MKIYDTIHLFDFSLDIVWIRGFTIVIIFFMTDLRLILDHPLIPLDVFVDFFQWISFCLLFVALLLTTMTT